MDGIVYIYVIGVAKDMTINVRSRNTCSDTPPMITMSVVAVSVGHD